MEERDKNKKSVFAAMSGGVDSSVAAFLLKQAGYGVTGVFMRSYNLDGCAERDAADARRVAEKLQIPFYVWDFEDEYKKRVVDYMVDGYRRGVTPNPDVMCNREIKFGLFLERALKEGADYVATGHYARRFSYSETGVASSPAADARPHLGDLTPTAVGDQARRASDSSPNKKTASFGLRIGKDGNKDQTYFLWTLTQKQLRRCLFPIGDYLKSEVREIARGAGLPTAEKKDSQGICFLGKISLGDFLRTHIPPKSGMVLSVAGEEIGEHDGAYYYTIGQRHGLNLGIKNKELRTKGRFETRPHYVADKDIKTNTIVVAEGDDNPALYKKEIYLSDVNFLNDELRIKSNGKFRVAVLARVRYRQALAPASVGRQGPGVMLVFDQPVKFAAPGQSAVFYLPRRSNAKAGGDNDYEMLGGGVITERGRRALPH